MVLFLLGTRARVAFLADGDFCACLRILTSLLFLRKMLANWKSQLRIFLFGENCLVIYLRLMLIWFFEFLSDATPGLVGDEEKSYWKKAQEDREKAKQKKGNETHLLNILV